MATRRFIQHYDPPTPLGYHLEGFVCALARQFSVKTGQFQGKKFSIVELARRLCKPRGTVYRDLGLLFRWQEQNEFAYFVRNEAGIRMCVSNGGKVGLPWKNNSKDDVKDSQVSGSETESVRVVDTNCQGSGHLLSGSETPPISLSTTKQTTYEENGGGPGSLPASIPETNPLNVSPTGTRLLNGLKRSEKDEGKKHDPHESKELLQPTATRLSAAGDAQAVPLCSGDDDWGEGDRKTASAEEKQQQETKGKLRDQDIGKRIQNLLPSCQLKEHELSYLADELGPDLAKADDDTRLMGIARSILWDYQERRRLNAAEKINRFSRYVGLKV